MMDIEKIFNVNSFNEAFNTQVDMIKSFEKCLTRGEGVDVVVVDARRNVNRKVMEYSLSFDSGFLKIDDVWVMPEYRGIGFGRTFFRILESAAKCSRANGVCYFPSFVTEKRFIDFLIKRGYVEEEIGYIKRFV